MTDTETWTLTEVAGYLKATSAGSARRTLSRWGVAAVGRQPGRGGESVYDRAAVEAARAARPGRGHRSDLTARQAEEEGDPSEGR